MRVLNIKNSTKPFRWALWIGLVLWVIGVGGSILLSLLIEERTATAMPDIVNTLMMRAGSYGFIIFVLVIFTLASIEEYLFRLWTKQKKAYFILSPILIAALVYIGKWLRKHYGISVTPAPGHRMQVIVISTPKGRQR